MIEPASTRFGDILSGLQKDVIINTAKGNVTVQLSPNVL